MRLNGNRAVKGILRGFDPFMNIVLDETMEVLKDGGEKNVGMVVSVALKNKHVSQSTIAVYPSNYYYILYIYTYLLYTFYKFTNSKFNPHCFLIRLKRSITLQLKIGRLRLIKKSLKY